MFDFIAHLTKKLRLDNMALATAMFFVHRFFKVYSMKNPNRNPRLLGVAAVMLSAKIRYCPIVLKKAIEAFFTVEKTKNPSCARAELAQAREDYYRDQIEQLEMGILDVLGFELEVELPYKFIAEICKDLAEPAVRDALH